jgi:phytoene dehydrogenase-like protein
MTRSNSNIRSNFYEKINIFTLAKAENAVTLPEATRRAGGRDGTFEIGFEFARHIATVKVSSISIVALLRWKFESVTTN